MSVPKNISKLHVITDDLTVIEQVCHAGCNWIQLRIKDKTAEDMEHIALAAREITNAHNATLIINDHIELARKVRADGVHLGSEDMRPSGARKILGPGFIIGGTANTIEDIGKLANDVDYIGLGPFRFTETKKNLSPVLGLEGYQLITEELETRNRQAGRHGPKPETPIIAIGDITTEDIQSLLETGVHGVAVSSAIAKAEEVQQATKEFINKLNYGTVSYC